MHVVKVSSKGQIVIPKEVRTRHRLGRDTDIVLLESGDALVLRKKADVEGILRDEFAPLLRATEDALRGLWYNPQDNVWVDVYGEDQLDLSSGSQVYSALLNANLY